MNGSAEGVNGKRKGRSKGKKRAICRNKKEISEMQVF